LAHAHRKPVIILMKSPQDEVERRAPFDVKTHVILGYTTVDENLKERIRSMLVETRWILIAPPHLTFQPAKLEESPIDGALPRLPGITPRTPPRGFGVSPSRLGIR
jgi:hypothetical protein